MSGSFLQRVLDGGSIRMVDCAGYSSDELDKIARLYDIRLQGQLRLFLADMGKSDGGLVGDSMIQLYRPSWRVREHLLFQLDFFSQMQEEGFYGLLGKPFVFSLIAETQYYFIQTIASDAVYHYDSNSGTAGSTEWDLVGFLKMLASQNDGHLKPKSHGSLLEI
jgi:hypothetical protein